MSSIIPSNISFDAYDNQIYPILMHFNGFVALIFGFWAMYFTLFYSLRIFGKYKYFLFNISFWAFCFDFYMTMLYHPKLLFPALVMCPTGLLETNNNTFAYIQFFLFLFFFGTSTIAILSAFIYRYAALRNGLHILLSWPFLIFLGILHLTYELPTITFYLLGAQNRTAIDEAVLTQWPLIRHQYLKQGCASVHFSVTRWPLFFMSSCALAFALGVPSMTFLIYKSFSLLKKQQKLMSPKTYKMHRQLLISLIFQLLVPLISLFGPFIVLSILVLLEFNNVAIISQIGFILGTFHSPLNAMMMFFFIPHYKRTLLRKIIWWKRDSNDTSSSEYHQTRHTVYSTAVKPDTTVILSG